MLVASCLLAAFVLGALLIPSGPLTIDQRWSDWMRSTESDALTHLALVFNYLGRGLGRALTMVAIGLILLLQRRLTALVAFAAAESVTPLVSSVTKGLVGRPRPPDPLIHVPAASFPSGHAAYAGATCVVLVLLFSVPGPRRRVWWALAALGIVGMAWSRTYLQAHWLSDVIAGSILGIGVTLLVFASAQLRSAAWTVLPGGAERRS
jgi:undecaprenyl-diphosphatase